MPVNLTAINGRLNSTAKKEYICDSQEEIKLLPKLGVYGTFNKNELDKVSNEPCSIGSTALVLKPTLSVWILSPSNEWVQI